MSHASETVGKKQQQQSKIDPGNLLLIVYMCFVVFLVLLGSFGVGQAGELESVEPVVTLDDVTRGELLIPTGNSGDYVCSPILNQDITVTVNGMVARTKVRQQFVNNSKHWIEGKYVFPLPDESAVDSLMMIIGERKIIGEIKEKEEAKKIYEKAKSEGKKSSLLVQKRPNMFITSVANIGPGEQVTIEIEYQEKVRFADDVFSLRFPMAITLRYQPPSNRQQEDSSSASELSFTGNGWSKDSYENISENNVAVDQGDLSTKLTLSLESGFPLARLDSLYHTVKAEEQEGMYQLTLTGRVKADRDFVLEWEAKANDKPQAALFSEIIDNERYMLFMLMPPKTIEAPKRLPREVVFILDTSGSMSGESIRQAKNSLLLALNKLQPTDTFNVIEFNNDARALFMNSHPANAKNITTAHSFVSNLVADGGTEMVTALNLALDSKLKHERIKQLVFITDGAVTNEEELFKIINQRLGDARLFTVGIGSAPNAYFMSRAATIGRGIYTYIAKTEEVQQKMGTMFEKISFPQMNNIRFSTKNGQLQDISIFPTPVPDLYHGEPLLVSMKVPADLKEIQVQGESGVGKVWNYKVNLSSITKDQKGVAKLWARAKIRDQMESLALGAAKGEVKAIVLQTALQHHLVSKYTSLVAVEQKVSRPEGATLKKGQVNNLTPKGSQPSQANKAVVYAGGSKTATAGTLYFILAICCISFSLLLFTLSKVKVSK